jgi:glutathione synthase/RimK-type ligase-like ATP-grasp enzyme
MTKEQILKELKNKSEVINDSLWYVNPDDVIKAISQTREETIREVKEMLSKIVLKDLSGKWSEEVIDFSTSIVDATVFKIKRLLNKLKK